MFIVPEGDRWRSSRTPAFEKYLSVAPEAD